ncbi:MAG: alpha/beta hydrolase [Alphaproteobacteria bacterium]|nr:alpha/beta hydrolase [Alphaproteobacteria bacterium]
MTNADDRACADRPVILTVPGLNNSGPKHWQTLWDDQLHDCLRVDLGMWDRPHRNTWVNKLNLAIRAANRPVVLVAHSLGCLAVAWWAQLEQPHTGGSVLGALQVAPPEVDFFPLDERLETFAPTPTDPLPFPSILAASRNDPYMGIRTAHRLARSWGSRFADAGAIGHINAESGIGDWPFGQFLLEQLIKPNQPLRTATREGAGTSGEAFRLAHGREALPAMHS